MKRAIDKLNQVHKIDKIIVDGKFTIPDIDIPQEAIIRADTKFWEMGAASIIAKVSRDNLIAKLGEKYPYYGLKTNAGYYTPTHLAGLIEYGPTPYHRKEFMFFKYAMFCHNEYKQSNSSLENYLSTIKKGHYSKWKEGAFDCWKEIKYGD